MGLISADTHRAGSSELLKKYGKAIAVPFRVALPDELGEAVESLSGAELILIDTAGHSSDTQSMSRLRASLAGVAASETHLVVSATAGLKSALSVAQRFAETGADRMVLTKLDEVETRGHLLDVVLGTGMPLSYVTTGQKVPEDIEVAEGRPLAEVFLGKRPLSGLSGQ